MSQKKIISGSIKNPNLIKSWSISSLNKIKQLFAKKNNFNKNFQDQKFSSFKGTKNESKKPNRVEKLNDKSQNLRQKDVNSVVLKPRNAQIINQKLNDKNKTAVKFFTFGQKNLTQILDKKPDFLKTLSQNINLVFRKIKILQTPNKLIGGILVVSLILFFLYISFFDTYFLIKNWQVTFSKDSYLSKTEQELILNKFSSTKIIGIFPTNQFWFVNDRNLTLLAQNIIPEILGIRITNRSWPNKIDIEVTTVPILLTVKTIENGESRMWRVLPNGKILTQDKAGIAENLLVVERPINFDQRNFDLQKYPIFEDIGQLNRLYFVVNLWSYLKEFGIFPVQTVLPSLNSADKDVFVTLNNGTKLYFDSSKFSEQTQKDRLQSVLESGIMDKIKSGELQYVDFRISKRVHLCPKNKDCAKENLQTETKPETKPESKINP